LFFVGLLPLLWGRDLEKGPIGLGTTPGLRLIQWQVLAGISALTLHDYKLDRNLYGTLPLLYLAALLPVGASKMGMRPLIVIGSLILAFSGYQGAVGLPTLRDRYSFEGDPDVHQALDFILQHAKPPKRARPANNVSHLPHHDMDRRFLGKGPQPDN
jgi:hypothetical protein